MYVSQCDVLVVIGLRILLPNLAIEVIDSAKITTNKLR